MELLVNNSQETENLVGEIDIYNKDINLLNLTNKINETRDILNEICCTFDEDEPNLKVLTVSQFLDELIVEYMKEKKKQEFNL
jgi:two-component system, cell cycle response regulator